MKNARDRIDRLSRNMPGPGCWMSREEREEIIHGVFDEYLTLLRGEPLERVYSNRANLPVLVVAQIKNFANAIQAPLEDVLPWLTEED